MVTPSPGPGEKAVAADLPRSVLFICTRNAIRSPMAQALADRHCRRRVYVDSAGVDPGEVDGFAIAAMAEAGLDIANYHPKPIGAVPIDDFDLIVSLSPEAHHKVIEQAGHGPAKFEYWPTMDPTAVEGRREDKLVAYRNVRDSLLQRIRQRFPFAAPGHL